jgi:hypothetical protein
LSFVPVRSSFIPQPFSLSLSRYASSQTNPA